MRTKPPCKVDGVDCQRRRVGCRAECKEWREWQAAHERECEQMRQNKTMASDADEFLVQQPRRARLRSQAQYEQNRRNMKNK